MPLYTVYATTTQLAEYLGIDIGDLPSDATRLLQRASELIKQVTLNNIDETDTTDMEYAELATCAQVEYWITDGESISISHGVAKYKLGEFQIDYNMGSTGDSTNRNQLSTRSKNYLDDGGLTYRGVKLNGSNTNDLTN